MEFRIRGADTRIVLFWFKDRLHPGTKMNITSWADDDVEKTVGELQARGVHFLMKPQEADWDTAVIFKDTDAITLHRRQYRCH